MNTKRRTIWTSPAAFEGLVQSVREVVVERGIDDGGVFYALVTREGTEFCTRPAAVLA